MQAHTVPNLYREIRDQLEYSVDDGRGFVHRIVWTPDHPPMPLKIPRNALDPTSSSMLVSSSTTTCGGLCVVQSVAVRTIK